MFKYLSTFSLVIFLLLACNTGNEGNSAVELLSPEQFKQKMEATNNKMVIDLRTHGELHQTGPIAGAKNFDYNSGKMQLLKDNLNKDISYFLYCASGGRSGKASEELLKAGATKIYDLNGGINAWQNAGYDVASHSH